MKADRIGLATILVMLTLVIVSEATGVQQTGETAALAPAASTSPTEMPQVQRDGLIEMRLESNPLTVRVAEPIQIRLDVDAPEGSQVTPPIIGSALGQLEVVDRQWIQALPIDGDPKRRRWTLLLKLESIESGQFTVPPMEMLYRLPEDFSTSRSAQRSVRSKPFAIEVTSLLGEDQDPKAFRDIKAAIQTPQIEATRQLQQVDRTGHRPLYSGVARRVLVVATRPDADSLRVGLRGSRQHRNRAGRQCDPAERCLCGSIQCAAPVSRARTRLSGYCHVERRTQ